MKVGIIGAGVSGLSMAQLLGEHCEVEVLEAKSRYGGIAHAKIINGVPYHLTGGHCLNSKNQGVLDFIFSKIYPLENWRLVTRKSKILLDSYFIDYPIEFSIDQIYQNDPDLAYNITRDFLAAEGDGAGSSSLGEWFVRNFGKTLAEKYFIPYNEKIWGMSVFDMDPSWVSDKLPLPDKKSFFRGLLKGETDSMPHSKFYYPKTNTQNTFLDALAKGIDITFDYEVDSIVRSGKGWLLNNEKEFDEIVYTGSLKELPCKCPDTPSDIKERTENLVVNKLTNMLWETSEIDGTWVYFPGADQIIHRCIHIGNFIYPEKQYAITEAIGERSREEMIEGCKSIPYLKKPVDYHVSEMAYVVFDRNYGIDLPKIKKHYDDFGLHLLGRFGEWEYYNMDICIEKAMELSRKLLDKYNKV